jgi:pimeloyl-ACP methyl ester carboxylesterase
VVTLSGDHHGGIEIHYEESGAGDPLILIGGLTSTLEAWGLMVPELSNHYRVVTPDNRGSGSTRLAEDDGVRTPGRFARDILTLVDGLGLDRFHLMGVSMGGMIVQEFALAHPDRLASLTIGCSHAGGKQVVSPTQEVVQALMAGSAEGSSEEAREAAMAIQIHPDTPMKRADQLAYFVDTKKDHPHSAEELLNRIRGIGQFDVYDRLPDLDVTTLVLTGSHDQLVPKQNSSLIASQIPGATLVEIAEAGHIFFAEQPQATNAALLDFVSQHRV